MTRLTASQLREGLADAINKVAFGGERIILRRNDKDVVAIVSMDDFNLLRELEDKLDLDAMKVALAEPGADIPWAKIKEELGI